MINEVIGNSYKLVEKIGEGGMGEVFRGVDINLDREVAIKVMAPWLARSPEILQRFRKEAVVLAKLNHPNIATLYNFIHDGRNHYMVMEFAPGETLDVLIANCVGGLPWRYALELFMDALQAIDHAHKQGIIHRDIKPANMMVSERDTLKVLDFGLGRVLGESEIHQAGHRGRDDQVYGPRTDPQPQHRYAFGYLHARDGVLHDAHRARRLRGPG